MVTSQTNSDSPKTKVEKSVSDKKEDIKDQATEKKDAFVASMSGKIGTEAKEFGEKLSHEAKEFGDKIGHLPVNKKFIFFTGITLIVLALLIFLDLASLSAVLILLIGIGMAYVGVSDNNPITKMMQEKAKKK
jgi:hypothetical protein